VDLLAARRPAIERDGIRIDLIAGQAGGSTGPAVTEWPISGATITLDPGRPLDHLLPGRDRTFLTGRPATSRSPGAWSRQAGRNKLTAKIVVVNYKFRVDNKELGVTDQERGHHAGHNRHHQPDRAPARADEEGR
jgi:hypothetical protein